jgi:hypothetical protein
MTVGSSHKTPISDDVVFHVFHPTTGGGRTILLTREDVSELHGELTKWLAEGWAGFVDGAPRPGQGLKGAVGEAADAGSVWDALERRREEAAERQRKAEEAFANTYASWSHDELVQELKLLKWNKEAAEERERGWKLAVEREEKRVQGLFARLRKALAGKRTASVDDLNTALKEPEEETQA